MHFPELLRLFWQKRRRERLAQAEALEAAAALSWHTLLALPRPQSREEADGFRQRAGMLERRIEHLTARAEKLRQPEGLPPARLNPIQRLALYGQKRLAELGQTDGD